MFQVLVGGSLISRTFQGREWPCIVSRVHSDGISPGRVSRSLPKSSWLISESLWAQMRCGNAPPWKCQSGSWTHFFLIMFQGQVIWRVSSMGRKLLSNPAWATLDSLPHLSMQIKILISALQDKNEMSLFICNLLAGYTSYLLPQGFLVIDDPKAPGAYNHKCLLLMCLVLLGVG